MMWIVLSLLLFCRVKKFVGRVFVVLFVGVVKMMLFVVIFMGLIVIGSEDEFFLSENIMLLLLLKMLFRLMF